MRADIELFKLLRRAKFFSDYTNKELKTIYKYFTWSSYIEGEVIYKENEMGNEMSIILYGEAKVSSIKADKRIDLAILKEGDILGETSILIKQPRFATVIAYTNCELATIAFGALQLLINKEKNVALKFILQLVMILADRFRSAKIEIKQNLLQSIYEKAEK